MFTELVQVNANSIENVFSNIERELVWRLPNYYIDRKHIRYYRPTWEYKECVFTFHEYQMDLKINNSSGSVRPTVWRTIIKGRKTICTL